MTLTPETANGCTCEACGCANKELPTPGQIDAAIGLMLMAFGNPGLRMYVPSTQAAARDAMRRILINATRKEAD